MNRLRKKRDREPERGKIARLKELARFKKFFFFLLACGVMS